MMTEPLVLVTMPQTILISVVFARAIRAEQAEDLTFVDLEIDGLERLKSAGVGLRQFIDADDGLHGDGSYIHRP